MSKKNVLIGLFAALLLAILISPFASEFPDGLERVAEDKGFIHKSNNEPVLASPVPDYTWPGIANPKLATSISGAFGTLIVFAFGSVLALTLKKIRG